MAYPREFLDELRSRIGLVDLIGQDVQLMPKGASEYAGPCPFHHDENSAFYVVEDKRFFHCFGCGSHGDAIAYVMRADDLDFAEAVERLADEAGLAVPHSDVSDGPGQ